jgi:SAM-dependent methyltransferase
MYHCEVCGTAMKKTYRNMSKKESTLFLRCPKCKLRWAPKLDIDPSFKSKLNESSRKDALSELRNREFSLVNVLLSRYIEAGSNGLEVGCSYGWYLETIKDTYQAEGIEPEFSIAEEARARGYKVWDGFFPDDIPKDRKYNFIVFNNVWEHINNTSYLIEQSKYHLKDNGFLIITIPLSSGGLYKLAEFFEFVGWTKWLIRLWQLHFHSPHIYYFNKKNLRLIMKNYGFDIESVHNCKASINLKRMQERFEMDIDEKHGKLNAIIFQVFYPIFRMLPADKAVFVCKYKGRTE